MQERNVNLRAGSVGRMAVIRTVATGPRHAPGKCWPRSARAIINGAPVTPAVVFTWQAELTPLSRRAEGRDWALMYLRVSVPAVGVICVYKSFDDRRGTFAPGN